MNDLEKLLDYPHGDTLPEPGTTLEVAPGVRWLRMRLPFQLDHINLWLLRDEIETDDGPVAGWTIVDCGIDNPPTRAAWEQIFANELGGLPVLRVIVTHMHPDHMGLAHWLTERWAQGRRECRLWISALDYHVALLATTSRTGFGGDATARFFASHGLADADWLEQIRGRTNYYIGMVPKVPAHYRRLADGEALRIGGRDWRCLVGHGHAPEHMSLHCAETRTLISGDMVLPRISTNVSVHETEPESNPLTQYLESIQRTQAAVAADTLVLPSHGRPFRGLHTRIEQLIAHHDERLAEVVAACGEAPQSAADLLMVIFKRKLDLHQTTFAMGESLAHLHTLWVRGVLARRLGDDGVYRFALRR